MSNSPKRQFIVLCGQIVGGDGRPFETVYGWDGKRFSDRRSAINRGLQIRGSDDFNLGILEGGRLVGFCWMEEPMHLSDADELPGIAEQIGVKPPTLPGSARREALEAAIRVLIEEEG